MFFPISSQKVGRLSARANLPLFSSRNQNECLEEVKKHEEEVRVFHETYDTIVAQDKVS